jgi:hypothetical protein
MARGWESKDVESRQEQADADRRASTAPRLPAEAQARESRRRQLMLDRVRVAAELKATPHDRRKRQLRADLAHLDAELAKLD